jgi:hypothetical protein
MNYVDLHIKGHWIPGPVPVLHLRMAYRILWGERLEYAGRVLISPGGTERRTEVRATWQIPIR